MKNSERNGSAGVEHYYLEKYWKPQFGNCSHYILPLVGATSQSRPSTIVSPVTPPCHCETSFPLCHRKSGRRLDEAISSLKMGSPRSLRSLAPWNKRLWYSTGLAMTKREDVIESLPFSYSLCSMGIHTQGSSPSMGEVKRGCHCTDARQSNLVFAA